MENKANEPGFRRSLEVRGGKLIYQADGGQVWILGFEGNASRLDIPDKIEGLPVTQIQKKAFFNAGFLHAVTLPKTMEKVDNWAFAHCRMLEYVRFSGDDTELGKDLFVGSDRLKEVAVSGKEEVAALLAVAATKMEAPYLFDLREAGSGEWLKKWDARMLVILREDANEGFEKEILAGEEDYERTDQRRFRNQKRRAKVRLAFIRLLHPMGLPESIRIELEGYLRAHTKNCRTEEAWQVLLEEYGDERAYFELFTKLGCVTQENFDAMLQDIGEGHPEMKAYLMRYQEEQLGRRDFFDSLSLDF